MHHEENDIPFCQGAIANVRAPSFDVPFGACDTHAHVIGDFRFPMVPNRSYTPPVASEQSYLAMLDAQGMTHGVLVQVSIYGTDNSCMVETLRRHRQRLRGIAVVSPDISDAELEQLADAGVRGVRINVLFGGGVALEELERLAARIAPLGWHVQLLIDARILPEIAPLIARLPVEVVFDHMGHIPVEAGVDHPGFQSLIGFLKDGKAWVKLSGAQRISAQPAVFDDTVAFARALVGAAPDRCVWGSDWPHVAFPHPMFNTADLLDLMPAWAPDEAQRNAILVSNPATLYGFPAATESSHTS
jgi:2-pyrone-4,6-dicarboxylate lactonase